MSKQLSSYTVTLQDVGHGCDVARRHYTCEALPQGVRVHPRHKKPLHPLLLCDLWSGWAGVGSWALMEVVPVPGIWCKGKVGQEECCGNSELYMSLQPEQPVFTQCSPKWQGAGLWSQRAETGEDVSGSAFYQCRLATSWERSSCSLSQTK